MKAVKNLSTIFYYKVFNPVQITIQIVLFVNNLTIIIVLNLNFDTNKRSVD